MQPALLLSLLLAILPNAARAAACGSETIGGQAARYCLSENPASDTVLYFFHAATANEQQWENGGAFSGRALQERWQRLGVKAPSVISVSFGPTWIFNASSARAFHNSLRSLEAKLTRSRIQQRWAAGASMGGLNTGILALQLPGVFAKAAALCPAISTLSPFASAAEREAFRAQTSGTDRASLDLYANLFQPLYQNENRWQRERLDLEARERNPGATRLYVNYNGRDQMGFAAGGSAFAQALKQKNSRTQVEAIGGGHCKDIFTDQLARFLSDL